MYPGSTRGSIAEFEDTEFEDAEFEDAFVPAHHTIAIVDLDLPDGDGTNRIARLCLDTQMNRLRRLVPTNRN